MPGPNSVFYGANEPVFAIAEVRPPIGSRVAVAGFEIIRPLRLLDLTALRAVSEGGSVFDPELAARMGARNVLTVAQPAHHATGDAGFDYLPTQAIADFLATENSNPKPRSCAISVFAGTMRPSRQPKHD